MNYEYLHYWIEAMEEIKLLEQLMKNNLHMYRRTRDMLYLEYTINNIKEIFSLKQLSKEYYNKYYYILPGIPQPQKNNIKEISRLRHLAKNTIVKMIKTNTSPTTQSLLCISYYISNHP